MYNIIYSDYVISKDIRRCCMARIFDVILAKSGNPENTKKSS
ncbi:hypothetical protein [Rickettsia endosymbiont of Orchestes rusci]